MTLYNEKADALRRRMLKPWSFASYLWLKLPLAAAAGLRLQRLDEECCVVALPGGWRTQNPFGSTYFAAQAMAAEMSTGAPALVLTRDAPASVAMLVVSLRARYSKKLVGAGVFTCEDVAGLAAAIARAASSDDPQAFTARSTGRDAAGEVVAEFEIDWSFRRRAPRA